LALLLLVMMMMLEGRRVRVLQRRIVVLMLKLLLLLLWRRLRRGRLVLRRCVLRVRLWRVRQRGGGGGGSSCRSVPNRQSRGDRGGLDAWNGSVDCD
jgi:hypothetical protein